MKKGKRGREEKMGKKKRKKREEKGKGGGKTHLKIFSVLSQCILQVFVYLSKPQT